MSKKPLGPGPGAYAMPTTVGYDNHDPTRHRNPMYSFSTSAGYRRRPVGPAPTYCIERMTRDGCMSAPAWTMGARLVARKALRTPGPGAHAPERCPPMRDPRAPAYTMGARLGFPARRLGPAPNAYALQLGPGSPAYTMGARVGFEAKPRSPGPALYFQRNADTYRLRHPAYTMGARLERPGQATRTPGPAAYPPRLYDSKKTPYSYSFGIKHADWAPPLIVKEDTMDCI